MSIRHLRTSEWPQLLILSAKLLEFVVNEAHITHCHKLKLQICKIMSTLEKAGSSITPARTHSSGLKSRILKLTFLALKMMVKSGLDFFFEIHRAPSEIPANLPGQFSPNGQIF